MSLKLAHRAAADARRNMGLGDDSPLPDILRLVEGAGVRVFGQRLDRDGIDGAYERVREAPFILLNLDKVPQRIRFTLAHEYGHHRLEHGAKAPERVNARDTTPVERDANSFAAALLMPSAAVARWFEAHDEPAKVDLELLCRLACDFGVSALAMRFRLEDLGRLRGAALRRLDGDVAANEHTRLMRELAIAVMRDSVSEACRAGFWLPVEHQRNLLALLDRGRATEETIARQLPEGMSVQALRDLAAPDLLENREDRVG